MMFVSFWIIFISTFIFILIFQINMYMLISHVSIVLVRLTSHQQLELDGTKVGNKRMTFPQAHFRSEVWMSVPPIVRRGSSG